MPAASPRMAAIIRKRSSEAVDGGGSCKRNGDAITSVTLVQKSDQRWSLSSASPQGWETRELEPSPPRSESCFAALLHGEKNEYFLYACVLGRRLRDGSPGPDRVLLCGPGCCEDPVKRRALVHAGWSHLLPVEPIAAPHLDQTRAKRHALVFTKLRVLELPYTKVLLLDLDLLPRLGTQLGELFEVAAPAGKFHCIRYHGPEPRHAEIISMEVRQECRHHWSPNAGVMRLDPRATLDQRRSQVADMISDIIQREGKSFLPEQYFLAQYFCDWRHVNKSWNWEVWPEWDDPCITHPLPEACKRAQRQGWAGYYLGICPDSVPEASTVLADVRVWHFSGSWDTAPWMFQNLVDADAVRVEAMQRFRSRDPGGVVATALYEWRSALDEIVVDTDAALDVNPLRAAVSALASQAADSLGNGWTCDGCGEPSRRLRELKDVPWSGMYCSGQWSDMHWACADCIVAQLRAANFEECSCTKGEVETCRFECQNHDGGVQKN